MRSQTPGGSASTASMVAVGFRTGADGGVTVPEDLLGPGDRVIIDPAAGRLVPYALTGDDLEEDGRSVEPVVLPELERLIDANPTARD